jgi:hypothetical protein
MKKEFKLAHALHDEIRGRWNERGIPWSCATDPVLTSAELAWLFVAASSMREKDFVNLANETQRKGKSLSRALQPVIERGNVVRDRK